MIGKKYHDNKKKIFVALLFIIISFNLIILININILLYNDLQQVSDEEILLNPSSHYTHYSYYKNLVIDYEKVEGTLNHVDFPVLFSIIDEDLTSHVQSANGYDIAFFLGSEQLDQEVELYNPNYDGIHPNLVAWVRVPTLSSTFDTTIRMHYGNSSITSSQDNAAGVWDNNYIGVYHLNNDPSGTIVDSTNQHHGSSSGAMNINNLGSSKLGLGITFDGTNDYINLGNDNDFILNDELTIEAWVKRGAVSSNTLMGIGSKMDYSYSNSRGYALAIDNGDDYRIQANNEYAEYPSSFDTYYHHVVGTINKEPYYFGYNYHSYIHFDGEERAYRECDDLDDYGSNAIIGRFYSDYSANYWNGIIDEFRISNIVRSDGWLKTEYNNQNEPYSFYSVGEEKEFVKPEIGVKIGEKYIYELVEKKEEFKDFLPQMHDLVDATYWMVLINETNNMDPFRPDGLPASEDDIVAIYWYFDVAGRTVLGTTYTVSWALDQQGLPAIEGISEWRGDNLDFGTTVRNNIIDGTATLPGLVGNNTVGTGVLEFLELYDMGVENVTIRNEMLGGYGLTPGSSSDWAKLTWLTRYYREYFVPVAIPMLEPYARYQLPIIQYVDIMDRLFEGDEQKGDYYCSEITEINNFTGSWEIMVDNWNFTTNMNAFNENSTDTTQIIEVVEFGPDLGPNINCANITLENKTIMPVIVDIYLEGISWTSPVKRQGNTISEILYSGPVDPYPFEEINLTYSIEYDNNGMMKRTRLFGEIQYTELFIERIVFYEIAFYVEEKEDPNADSNSDNSRNDGGLNSLDSRIIVLSSISLTFALGLLYVLKKSKGFRR